VGGGSPGDDKNVKTDENEVSRFHRVSSPFAVPLRSEISN
jgi:hypothetical protein